MPPPTMPVVTISPDAGWVMCIGPPLPLQVPVGPAEELGPQLPQRHALGEVVVQAAVGGDDVVVGAKVRRRSRR